MHVEGYRSRIFVMSEGDNLAKLVTTRPEAESAKHY